MTKKYKTIYAQVSDDVYSAFIEAANRQGVNLRQLAGELIEQGLMQGDLLSDERRAILQMKRQQNEREEALKVIAKEYKRALEFGDDEKIEELLELASSFGITRVEVETLATINLSPMSTTTGVERALTWLAQYMAEKRIAPVKEILQAAEQAGLSVWAVKQAARVSPSIKSVKTGQNWSWVMETN